MAGKFRYRVIEPCFYGGCYRTPDHHGIVSVAEKFDDKKKPSYLELIDDKAPVEKADAIDATDSAVSLAEENDIDLANVQGSGANGRITKGDVQKVIDAEVI